MSSKSHVLIVEILAAMMFAIANFGCGGGSASSPPPPSITVSVSPSAATVPGGGSQAFKATVGNDPSNGGVNWTLVQNGSSCSPACGTISPLTTKSGTPTTYTAPVTVPTTPQVTITATAATDPTKSANGGITIPSPLPLISQPLVPGAVAPAQEAFILTVNGTGFLSGSVVNWNGNARTTTFVNSSQLQADIMASDIATAATASITVFNPAPGGGTSNPVFLQITPSSKSVSMTSAEYVTASVSYGIAVADFRGSRRTDIAETNYDSATVGALLGNGDGTFQGQVSYNVGGFPQAVAIGDFNGDGKPDLVVTATGAPPNPNALSVLLGNGDGTFQTPAKYATGGFPFAVAVGDFNRDGHLDLVVANYGDANVGILFGNGDGTFQAQTVYSCSCPLGPTSVAVGDFNDDGVLDLVAVDNYGAYVLLGNGDGSFQAPVSYSRNFNYESVVVADFNGDAKLDLALVAAPPNQNNGSAISIFLGNGDGTFQPPVDFYAGPSPSAVVAGDFNGDGRLDLAVANGTQPASVSILLSNGDGTFQAPLTFGAGNDTWSYGGPLAVGDFNGDGRLDLAVDIGNVYSDLLDGVSVLLQTRPGK